MLIKQLKMLDFLEKVFIKVFVLISCMLLLFILAYAPIFVFVTITGPIFAVVILTWPTFKRLYLEESSEKDDDLKKLSSICPKCGNFGRELVKIKDPFGDIQIKCTVCLRIEETNRNDTSGCFTGNALVSCLINEEVIEISLDKVKSGMLVETDNGFLPVKYVTVTPGYSGPVYVLENGLCGTPYHPVFDEKQNKWVHLKDHSDKPSQKDFNGEVFNLFFEKGSTEGVLLNGIRCAVLGHGVTSKEQDNVLGHPFFGDWETINYFLNKLKVDYFGRMIILRYTKDSTSELVNGVY